MKNMLFINLFLCVPFFLAAQDYAIGDMVKGGIVFSIAENGDSLLICGKNDAAQYVDWADAKMRCESFFSIDVSTMVKGWRMPTLAEMKILRDNRETINELIRKAGGIPLESEVGAYYWTSTEAEYSSHAYLQPFGFDLPQLMSKASNSFNARAVQTVYLK
jgi:hypothetical protein